VSLEKQQQTALIANKRRFINSENYTSHLSFYRLFASVL
jgi:hypothetical protein